MIRLLPSRFQPQQILCLEQNQGRLYAEVIQVVSDRPICWLRPLILEINTSNSPQDLALNLPLNITKDNPPHLQPQTAQLFKTYDLRLSPDLLMPPTLFRPALDTEVIPLLGQINKADFNLEEAQSAHKILRDFIQQVWQDNQDVFPR